MGEHGQDRLNTIKQRESRQSGREERKRNANKLRSAAFDKLVWLRSDGVADVDVRFAPDLRLHVAESLLSGGIGLPVCGRCVPEYRRQGLAGRLLMSWQQACAEQGVRRLLLEVRDSNHAAQQLYVKHGFQAYTRRRQYYSLPDGTREDAVLMEQAC